MFCMYNRVKRALKRRNISNGREITQNFRRNRQMIEFCDLIGLLRRWKTRAIHSRSIMQRKERLNVEISEMGEKQRLIFVKIGK